MDLTPRQREIALLVSEGLTAKEIAAQLGLSRQTVKNHKQRIYARLGAKNGPEMATLIAKEELA